MNKLELKSERVRKEITQEELAKKLEISYSAYVSKENGRTEFTREEIKNLKEILNLSDERLIEIFFKE